MDLGRVSAVVRPMMIEAFCKSAMSRSCFLSAQTSTASGTETTAELRCPRESQNSCPLQLSLRHLFLLPSWRFVPSCAWVVQRFYRECKGLAATGLINAISRIQLDFRGRSGDILFQYHYILACSSCVEILAIQTIQKYVQEHLQIRPGFHKGRTTIYFR